MAADGLGLAHDVVSEYARGPRIGPKQGGEHPDRRGLAGSVGAEHPVHDASGHGQLEPGDGACAPERSGKPGGFDRERRGWCHLCVSVYLIRACLRPVVTILR